MRVLMITSEWPTPEHPDWVPFIVQQVTYLRQENIEVQVFVFSGKKNPLNYLCGWLKLRRLHRIEDFDLIHVQWGQNGLLALPTRIPMVVTFHGSDLQGIIAANGRYGVLGSVLRSVSQYVAKYAKEIIVVSNHLVNYLPPQLSIHTIPCGMDFALFRPMSQAKARKLLGLPLNRPLVLFAANPQRAVKRFHLAQEAVLHLKSQFEAELVVMSGVPHTMVPLYMNACDVLVLTSKHEGSPTVVKEALACNLPIVSVDVGDVRQRIGQVSGCVLCSDDSPECIAQGLVEVLRVRRRIQGRETIVDLDERVVAQRIIDVYHSALEKHAPA